MIALHLIAVASVVVVFLFMCMLHSGHDEYMELKTELYNKFTEDFNYTLDLIKDLTPREADMKIDEFEEKWTNYISSHQLKAAIGKLIEQQFIGLGIGS